MLIRPTPNMCYYKWRCSHTTFKYLKVMDQTDKTSKAPCSILFLGKYTFMAAWKSMFRFGILRLVEVLHKDTEARGAQPTPGSFVLTSSLAADHKRFHSQAREHPACAVNSIHNPQQAASPWPLIEPRGTIHLRSLGPEKNPSESLEGAQDHWGREL